MTLVATATVATSQSAQPPAGDDPDGTSGARFLITTDGQRIESRGPWRVEGRRVLFTNDRGVLSSLRLSQVDLEASERLLESRTKAPASTGRHSAGDVLPALVLEAKDVPRFEGSLLPEAGESTPDSAGEGAREEGSGESAASSQRAILTEPSATGATAAASAATSSAPPSSAATSSVGAASPGGAPDSAPSLVAVAAWRDLGSYDEGIKIYGTLRNEKDTSAFNVSVLVRVLDEAGNLLGEKEVRPRTDPIAGGETSNFRAFFPDIPVYGAVEYAVRWRD